MGQQQEALHAFDALLARYPSPMIRSGCRTYLLQLRDGKLTPQEQGWLAGAEAHQQAQRRAQEWDRAACGPQAMAYLLGQFGVQVAWETLAHEARTARWGTSMGVLARCARKRGFSAVGLQVSLQKLSEQPLPALALLRHGHFVVVEQVSREGVQCWDPAGARKVYSPEEWRHRWDGYLLVLRSREQGGSGPNPPGSLPGAGRRMVRTWS